MMAPPEITSLRTNVPLRNLAILGIAVIVWAGTVFGWSIWNAYSGYVAGRSDSPSRLQVVSAYLTPIAAGVFINVLIRVARQGDCRRQRKRFWCGCGLIAGAAMLDAGVTLFFSPDLTEEGNPVIRILLDSGHALPVVIFHMLVSTAAVVAAFCAFWGAFLAHEPFLLETIHDARPKSWVGFLKAATGGAHLSFRQWLFPYRWSEIPRLYHAVWMAGVPIVFGVTFFRYYVSLEWLGVVDLSLTLRFIALAGGVAGSLVLYHILLAHDYSRSAPATSPDGYGAFEE